MEEPYVDHKENELRHERDRMEEKWAYDKWCRDEEMAS